MMAAAGVAALALALGLTLMFPLGGSPSYMARVVLVLLIVCANGFVLTRASWLMFGVLPTAPATGARIGAIPGLIAMWCVGMGEWGVSGHHVAVLYMVAVWVPLVLGGAGIGAYLGLALQTLRQTETGQS
jgi:hypothetical protein